MCYICCCLGEFTMVFFAARACQYIQKIFNWINCTSVTKSPAALDCKEHQIANLRLPCPVYKTAQMLIILKPLSYRLSLILKFFCNGEDIDHLVIKWINSSCHMLQLVNTGVCDFGYRTFIMLIMFVETVTFRLFICVVFASVCCLRLAMFAKMDD